MVLILIVALIIAIILLLLIWKIKSDQVKQLEGYFEITCDIHGKKRKLVCEQCLYEKITHIAQATDFDERINKVKTMSMPKKKKINQYTRAELSQLQFRFTAMLGLLIEQAYKLGFTIVIGDVFAHDGHKDNSFHYIACAVDLNLIKDGKYLKKTEDHVNLGAFWERMGGTWGGHWQDGNHYSLGE